jgi:hypothetical protein
MRIPGRTERYYRLFIGSDSKLMDFMFRLNLKSAAEMINRQMASLLK